MDIRPLTGANNNDDLLSAQTIKFDSALQKKIAEMSFKRLPKLMKINKTLTEPD